MNHDRVGNHIRMISGAGVTFHTGPVKRISYGNVRNGTESGYV